MVKQTTVAKTATALSPEFFPALDALPKGHREKIERIAKKRHERPAAPSMDLKLNDGVLQIVLKGESTIVQLMQMVDIGTSDPDFHQGLMGQIASIGSQSKSIDSGNSNFVMAVVRAIEPRDELEAMLAAQMGAIHAATMMMVRRLNNVTTIPQQDAAERALNKLARTYAVHMDTLKRYRSKGQQVVRVERVTVENGAQAVVGNVTHGGRGEDET
jgi:hypothetical protein